MGLNGVERFYHGTGAEFDQIDLGSCRDRRDFGRGFYVTSRLDQAQMWARSKGGRSGVCWVYEYCLDSAGVPLRSLALLEYDEKWLDVIAWCRQTGSIPEEIQRKWGIGGISEYDVVYDRMADNTWNMLSDQIRRYCGGKLSAEMALKQIPFRRKAPARDQYCFKSDKSVGLLRLCRAYRWTAVGEWEETP